MYVCVGLYVCIRVCVCVCARACAGMCPTERGCLNIMCVSPHIFPFHFCSCWKIYAATN